MFGELERGRGTPWSLRAGLSYAHTLEPASRADRAVDFSMLVGRLRAYVPAWRPARWLRAWPYVGVDGGAVWAGTVAANGSDVTVNGPFVAAGAGARLEVLPSRWFQLSLEVGPAVPLVHPRFLGPTGVELFTPAAVTFGAQLTGAARF